MTHAKNQIPPAQTTRKASEETTPENLYIMTEIGNFRVAEREEIFSASRKVADALAIKGQAFTSPAAVKEFLKLKMATLPHEVFSVLFLDAKNRLISYDEIFRGTLKEATVYLREIAKEALLRNAAAVIISHNHPSGEVEPSQNDIELTKTIKSVLDLIDVKTLDHIIIGASGTYAFSEKTSIL